jgi:CheY-like chemotaxis protein
MLRNWEMVPTLVSNGNDALRAMDSARTVGSPFGLVLSDVNMPEMDGFMLAEQLRGSPHHVGTPIVLLTSADRSGDYDRYKRLGISSHLMKPIKQSLLLDTIMTAVAGVGEATLRESSDSRPGEPHQPDGKPLSILLAEDNAVNQKFAVRTLTKAGHKVVVANNGKDAVEHWETEAFDVILMDVQMPEMDGLEATATIREKERVKGTHIPIIAMTAHAMKGDRERCLEAGMDGYVTKPIKASTMFAEIERLLSEAKI